MSKKLDKILKFEYGVTFPRVYVKHKDTLEEVQLIAFVAEHPEMNTFEDLNNALKANGYHTISSSYTLKPGDRISMCCWTDSRSYTVLEVKGHTARVQADKQLGFKDCWQDGEMYSEPDPEGSIIEIKWTKRNNYYWWHYCCYNISLGEYNYRDPSF